MSYTIHIINISHKLGSNTKQFDLRVKQNAQSYVELMFQRKSFFHFGNNTTRFYTIRSWLPDGHIFTQWPSSLLVGPHRRKARAAGPSWRQCWRRSPGRHTGRRRCPAQRAGSRGDTRSDSGCGRREGWDRWRPDHSAGRGGAHTDALRTQAETSRYLWATAQGCRWVRWSNTIVHFVR